MLQVDCVTDEKTFEQLGSQWKELLVRSRANTPFLTWEWGFSWWQAVKDDKHQLQILLLYDDHQLVGIAPLVIRQAVMYGFLRLRKVEVIGSELANGEYLDFITKPGAEEIVSKAVAEYLAQHDSDWDVLELLPWPEESTSLQYFSTACKRFGLTPYSYLRTVCLVINLPGDWESYRKSLSKSLRKNTEYQKQRLEKEHNAVFGKWENTEEVARDLPDFFKMHQKKWQAHGEPGSFADARKQRFYQEISNRFLAKKWLSVYYLRAKGRTVSYSFGIEYDQRYFDLQGAFDLEWQKYSVGKVLLYHALEKCVKVGLCKYDLLRGEEKYKYQFGAVPNRNMRLLVFKPGLLHLIYRTLRWRKAKTSIAKVYG